MLPQTPPSQGSDLQSLAPHCVRTRLRVFKDGQDACSEYLQLSYVVLLVPHEPSHSLWIHTGWEEQTQLKMNKIRNYYQLLV